MKKPESVFVRNPMTSSGFKKYIFFNRADGKKEDALAMFCQFLVEGIYIDGFATDEEIYIGTSAFHKPIVDVRKLDSKETVVFIEHEDDEVMYDICQPVVMVNPMLNKDNIVIFGAGKYGGEVFKQLLVRKVTGVQCYIDSNKAKCGIGKYKEGLPIYSIDALREMSEEVSIIEASEKYMEMDEFLQQKNCMQSRFYYENLHDKYLKYISAADEEFPIIVQYIYHMCVFFGKKKIYFYGNKTKKNCRGAECIKALDFDFAGFLSDTYEENEKQEYPSLLVEEILYEDNFFVVLENDKTNIKKLLELGLKKNIDFNILPQLSFSDHIMESVLDLNLGYTYKGNSRYPGITIYGQERKDDFKVAVLGGSTTDDGYDARNWARILYEEWPNDAITIYNGGTSGYMSTQELIKLERDIIPLKPDLVIVYDGFNDLCDDPAYPFAIPYLQVIFDLIKNNIDKGNGGYGGNDVNDEYVNLGVISKENHFENWLSRIKMMYAVAQSADIEFLAFAQPARCMSHTKANDDWLMSSSLFWLEEQGRSFYSFREMMESKKIEETYDYIFNLTDIFDDRTELFKDSCHLYEAGSKIIADNILRVIKEKGIIC